jgi:hypothetical protein
MPVSFVAAWIKGTPPFIQLGDYRAAHPARWQLLHLKFGTSDRMRGSESREAPGSNPEAKTDLAQADDHGRPSKKPQPINGWRFTTKAGIDGSVLWSQQLGRCESSQGLGVSQVAEKRRKTGHLLAPNFQH